MSDMLRRYSNNIKNIEMWYNLTRFRFKKIVVFGHEIRVPIKYAKEFEEKMALLEVTMLMTDTKYVVRSNHTMLEIGFLDGGMIDFSLDLEFFGFFVVQNKKFKPGSKLKRASFRKPMIIPGRSLSWNWDAIAEDSNEFHLIVDKVIEYLGRSK